MEHFDGSHQKVREKSIYILHLDGVRIMLISVAVIGVIIVSFLLGMNFIKGGKNSDDLSAGSEIIDDQKEMDLLKGNIPSIADEDPLTKPLEEKMGVMGIDETGGSKNGDIMAKNNTVELLTNENINEVIPPLNEAKKVSVEKNTSTERKSASTTKETVRKERKSDTKKKRSKKTNVIEVSGRDTLEKKKSGSPFYSIQVASFDTKSKALNEVKRLREMSYDARVDGTTVNGKQYYRVRIGPIFSKDKALNLLNKMQGRDRYSGSYMVKE